MKFAITHHTVTKQRSECIVLGVFEESKPSLQLSITEKSVQAHIQKILDHHDIQGKAGQTLMLYHVPGLHADRVLLVGCGKKAKLNETQYKKILRTTLQALQQTQVNEITCYLSLLPVKHRDIYWTVRFAVETLHHTAYEFTQFKTEKVKAPALKSVNLAVAKQEDQAVAETALQTGNSIAEAMRLCRDLANTPSNICTPTYMAEQAKGIAKLLPHTQVAVLEETDMKKLGMNCILAVGRGSNEDSKLIEIHYQGAKESEAPIVLVGKGVTFDTGGICLKTSQGMYDMKMDMSGAATMLSVLSAAAKLQLPLNIIALLPCVENMPDGKSYKPSDVLRSFAGKTIEVIDTDAEGRLILCDALTYAERFKPSLVIDAATLTGAIVVALGHHITGLFSNDEGLAQGLLEAGKTSGDPCWQLPIGEEYQAQLESKIADMSNLSNDRSAGSITAACFLARFAENYSWAHLDIAGTAMIKSAGTGRAVPLLVQFLIDRAHVAS